MKINGKSSAWLSFILLQTLAIKETVATVPKIFASAINYCGANQLILVEKFDLVIFPRNETVAFSIAASSVPNNIDATIVATLSAYGRTFVNTTTELCEVAEGVLCPLVNLLHKAQHRLKLKPAYNFNGTAEYFLPSNYLDKVPKIAYSVPNLEANLRIRLVNNANGEEATCLDVTLSNGLTTRHDYVSWAVGAVLILTFAVALIHPLFAVGPSWSGWDYRLLGLVGWLQHIAGSGMLTLSYPAAFLAFTRNFAWSFGLVHIDPVESSLLSTALKTGGSQKAQSSAIAITNTFESFRQALSLALSGASGGSSGNGVLTITQDGRFYNTTAGLALYADGIGFQIPTIFTGAFIVFLILAAIVIGLTILLGVLVLLPIARRHKNEHEIKRKAVRQFSAYAQLNALRWFIAALFPMLTLAIFQFYAASATGWALTLVAGILFVLFVLGAFAIPVYYFFVARKHEDGVDGLYEDPSNRLRTLPIIQTFKPTRSWFVLVYLCALFLRAIFVGGIQSRGLGQIIALIVVEAAFLLFLIIDRPFQAKGTNVLECFLAVFRIVNFGLMIAFTDSVTVDGIVETVLGFVILAIQSLVCLLLIVNILIRLVIGLVWALKHRKDESMDSKAWLHQDMAERKVDMAEKRQSVFKSAETPVVASAEPTASLHHTSPAFVPDSRHSSMTLTDMNALQPETQKKEAHTSLLSHIASEQEIPQDNQSSRNLSGDTAVGSPANHPSPAMLSFGSSGLPAGAHSNRHSLSASPRASQFQPIAESDEAFPERISPDPQTNYRASTQTEEGVKIWSPSYVASPANANKEST